ncbi:hypothetical protein MAPG_06801 [Magnaporthiopsis poae ATCC 64411]|uniref:Chitin synthesis regulation, Congo red resistance, RCR protein n=1 Tax=Magnaporthiopsis poae (strain ATCC 64411 / 73-15) TaxID=644358 RepID=A0A0C4E308_MAGP6|nr:hypothetical protein MAPG_06801 [Magnaporthiopsis poae ATCC 64411]
MSPLGEDAAAQLAKRYYYYCPAGYIFINGGCEYNAWAYWGRWVLTGVVILGIGLLLMMLGCLSARRRRRQGMMPMYGTGWMGGKYQGGPPHQQQQNGYYAPPPQYSTQPMPGQYTGSTFNPNDGYYGAQTQGVQPPPNAYVPPHRDSPDAGGDVPPPAARPSGK